MAARKPSPPKFSASRSNNRNPLALLFRLILWLLGTKRGWQLILGFVVFSFVFALGWYFYQPQSRRDEMRRWAVNYPQTHKRIRASKVLWDFWTLYVRRPFAQTKVQGGESIVYGGEPQRGAFPYEVRTLYNTAYEVGYCDTLCNPVWSAYRVFDLEKHVKPPPRPQNFFVDPRTSARVEPGDYTGSGYDRGHLTPNYAIATRFDHNAQEETFKMSNICPQRHRLNAGLWKELEDKIADNYTARFGQVWVVAGPVFGPLDRLRKINGKVPIPNAFFMIVIHQHEDGVRNEAFIMDQDAPSHGTLDPYLTTVSEIEQRTGLNFYPKLEKRAQQELESQKESSIW